MQVNLFATATIQSLRILYYISIYSIACIDSPFTASHTHLVANNFRETFHPEQLDIYWENLVLALIGETIDEGDEICGCRVVDKSPRKGVY